jgi:hypothetical protein
MKMVLRLMLAGIIVFGRTADGQLTTPADWRWRLDGPATLVTGPVASDSVWSFVGMPPGWHITTGPGVVLYHPAERASGFYSLSADFILFPDPSESAFGLVLGGSDLASASAGHLAVQLRRDGSVRIVSSGGGRESELAPWRVHPAVKPHPGTGTVTNRLRVRVGPDSLRVFVNDSAVVAVSAAGLTMEGQFGLQIGRRLNFHITTLDVTRHLAPARGARR